MLLLTVQQANALEESVNALALQGEDGPRTALIEIEPLGSFVEAEAGRLTIQATRKQMTHAGPFGSTSLYIWYEIQQYEIVSFERAYNYQRFFSYGQQ